MPVSSLAPQSMITRKEIKMLSEMMLLAKCLENMPVILQYIYVYTHTHIHTHPLHRVNILPLPM